MKSKCCFRTEIVHSRSQLFLSSFPLQRCLQWEGKGAVDLRCASDVQNCCRGFPDLNHTFLIGIPSFLLLVNAERGFPNQPTFPSKHRQEQLCANIQFYEKCFHVNYLQPIGSPCILLLCSQLLFSHFKITAFISRTDILPEMREFEYVSKRKCMSGYMPYIGKLACMFLNSKIGFELL